MAVGLGCRLAVGCGGGWVLDCGAAVAGFAGVRCRHTLLVGRRGAVEAVVVACASARDGFGGLRVWRCPQFGGLCVPGDVVVVEVGEVIVVVEVGELKTQKTDVGDGGGSRTAGPGAGCWVLWAGGVRVLIRALGVCACFPWCPVCMQLPVRWVVSCVVCAGVVEWSSMQVFNTDTEAGRGRSSVARSQRRKKKYQENDAPPEEIKRKIVFSDLRNPPNNFTPLFGEVAKFRTLTKKDEQ